MNQFEIFFYKSTNRKIRGLNKFDWWKMCNSFNKFVVGTRYINSFSSDTSKARARIRQKIFRKWYNNMYGFVGF